MSRVDLRVLFFGMLGEFSATSLRRLIQAGVNVCGVVVPALTPRPLARLPTPKKPSSGEKKLLPDRFLPMLPSPVTPNIISLAQSRSIPVIAVRSLAAPETLTALAGCQPDVICVACFPQIFPRAVLDLPPFGCLNLHPSLLPAYRGPAPLFWQFRQGETHTGVTVHFMDEGADTGDIVLQRLVEFPDGISGAEADRRCASVGAELMIEAVELLARGECPRQAQADVPSRGDVPPERLYQPWPTRADFEIPTDWPARRAFNFMRGAEEWGVPFEIRAGADRLQARRAIGFSPGERLEKEWSQVGEEMWIQFLDGVVSVEPCSPLPSRFSDGRGVGGEGLDT